MIFIESESENMPCAFHDANILLSLFLVRPNFQKTINSRICISKYIPTNIVSPLYVRSKKKLNSVGLRQIQTSIFELG